MLHSEWEYRYVLTVYGEGTVSGFLWVGLVVCIEETEREEGRES